MSAYSFLTTPNPTNIRHFFVESADPRDLERKVKEQFAALPGLGLPIVSALTLAGGGDGHTFVVTIEAASFDAGPISNLPGVLVATPGVRVTCYQAADDLELAKAAADAMMRYLALGALALIDSQLAGASKGTVFMGMLVGNPFLG